MSADHGDQSMVAKPTSAIEVGAELRQAADECEHGDVDAMVERVGCVLGRVHELRAEQQLMGGEQ